MKKLLKYFRLLKRSFLLYFKGAEKAGIMRHLSQDAIEGLHDTMLVIGTLVLDLRRKGGDLGTRAKEGVHWDIVTKADKLSEKILTTEYVMKRFSDHGVQGEEGANISSKSGYVWYFDPIDGTINYRRGSDFWGISAGLLLNGEPVFGAIYYPALGKFLSAEQGEGAFLSEGRPGHRLRVSPPPPTLKEALVIANCWVGFEHVFFAIRRRCMNAVMFGSMVFDVLTLVEGKVDAVFHMGASPFDIAAAVVIARAAGCTVSGIMTDELDFGKSKIGVIFARSESLRDELRAVIKEAMVDVAVK